MNFFHVSQQLERNLLSAVPEERQRVKSRFLCTSDNPYWSNASNTIPLCQNPVKLQMQINKQLNLMSSLLNFLILRAHMGTVYWVHQDLVTTLSMHSVFFLMQSTLHWNISQTSGQKKANLGSLWTRGHWVCLEMMGTQRRKKFKAKRPGKYRMKKVSVKIRGTRNQVLEQRMDVQKANEVCLCQCRQWTWTFQGRSDTCGLIPLDCSGQQ